jgi:hypothetical protein
MLPKEVQPTAMLNTAVKMVMKLDAGSAANLAE